MYIILTYTYILHMICVYGIVYYWCVYVVWYIIVFNDCYVRILFVHTLCSAYVLLCIYNPSQYYIIHNRMLRRRVSYTYSASRSSQRRSSKCSGVCMYVCLYALYTLDYYYIYSDKCGGVYVYMDMFVVVYLAVHYIDTVYCCIGLHRLMYVLY